MSEARVDCLADTSALIRLIRRDQQAIAVMKGREYGITVVTVGELYLGVLKSTHPETALARLHRLQPEEKVFYFSKETPFIYARIRHDLEQRGQVIPDNDMWIAALALEHNLPLVARDAHFERVKDLVFIPC